MERTAAEMSESDMPGAVRAAQLAARLSKFARASRASALPCVRCAWSSDDVDASSSAFSVSAPAVAQAITVSASPSSVAAVARLLTRETTALVDAANTLGNSETPASGCTTIVAVCTVKPRCASMTATATWKAQVDKQDE